VKTAWGRTRVAAVAAASLILIAACGGSADHQSTKKHATGTPSRFLDKQPTQEPASRHLTPTQVTGVLDAGRRLLNDAGTVGFRSFTDIGGVEIENDGRVDFRTHKSDVSITVRPPGGGGYEFRTVSRGNDVYGGYSVVPDPPKCWYHFRVSPGSVSRRWRDHPAVVLLQDARPRSRGSRSQLHVEVEVPLDAVVFTAFPRLGNLYPGTLPADLMVPAVIEVHIANDTNWRKGELKGIHFKMADVLKVAKKHGIDLITPAIKGSGGGDSEYRAVVAPIKGDSAANLERQISKVKFDLAYDDLGNPVPAPLPDLNEVLDVDPYSLNVAGSCGASQTRA
jgi:hypothetical protein